jgi:predicted RNase H-like nuclease (RuvC/YqgF family)
MAHNQLQDRYQDLKTQYEEHRDLVSILRRCLNELEGNQEMLSGQFQGLHYGVVML